MALQVAALVVASLVLVVRVVVALHDHPSKPINR